ncbi:phosphohistidine phosphatase SixA [Leptolyngbya sp. FACHB-261]|uniref:phosphohistidine phosphatase SixA n=1 Tax=Leptolyngbya sp. FACHB-261 TaxID=2692806 RepID=UPI0016886A99|nr:phosphohistidine phosphatase SixA [Leptolyngbya sp. FACHB-261]MBD2101443.1 phosphohistidine phosphatase SixA [Leptolyngbya sp. FACHB-261]
MQLYLIRHGLAGEHGSYANDAERPLTPEGQRKTRACAKRLATLGTSFQLILTSPLVRARQTAQILQEQGLSTQLQDFALLAPGGSFPAWLEWLQQWQANQARNSQVGNLALVGHNPDLSDWAETLIWGEARGVFVLKKAGVISLELPDSGSPVGRSLLTALLTPKVLVS